MAASGVLLILCKERPGHFVVVFAIWLDKRSLPGDGAALAFVAAGIVIKGDADGTGFQMFDIIPADGLIGAVTAGPVRAVDVKDKAVFQSALRAVRGRPTPTSPLLGVKMMYQAVVGRTRCPLRTGASPGTVHR